MPAPGPPPPSARSIGLLVWGAMVAFMVVFLGMVLAVEPPTDDRNASRGLLFGLALATSAMGIVLSRVLPPRIPARHTAHRPDATALVRAIVGWSLCQAVGIFPLVAHVLAHDHRLLGVFAVDVLALVTLFPSRDAWAELGASHRPSGPRKEG